MLHCSNCNTEVSPVVEFGGGFDPAKPTMGTVEKCPSCQMVVAGQAAPVEASRPRAGRAEPMSAPAPITTTDQIVAHARERLAYVEVELGRMAGLKSEAKALRRILKATEGRL